MGGEKVHFAFQAQCVEDVDSFGATFDSYHEGQFQFMDRENGVRFHGDIRFRGGVGGDRSCDDPLPVFPGFPQNVGEVFGECRSQPGDVTGDFVAYFEDNGRMGPNTGDFIRVETNCTSDGNWYSNEGYLKGGNISALGHHK